jgi:periplasmic protein TonB
MEPKKNPSKDVHRHYNATLLFSFGISLVIIIVAFEWQTKQTLGNDRTFNPIKEDVILLASVPITVMQPEAPKEIKIRKPIDITRVEVAEPSRITTSDEIDFEPVKAPDSISIVVPVVPVEPTNAPFIRVETMPEPEGGYEKFYQHLRKTMRYPAVARRSNKEGMVVVQFIVSESGSLSDFKIVRSVGAGCDEEAIRVIASSKWKAGKQRGRPVKVIMQQPIYFKLNN